MFLKKHATFACDNLFFGRNEIFGLNHLQNKSLNYIVYIKTLNSYYE